MRKIEITLSEKNYDVLIGTNCFAKISSEIKKRKLFKNILIVCDFNFYKSNAEYINDAFNNADFNYSILKLNVNEKSKTIISVLKIYDVLLKKKFGRDTLIVAIGGGIIGDVAGYAAATFMRGVQLVHIPTTLLADVDSSIGGKTGVNYGKAKNIVGAFYQPKFVLIDSNFLSTLPKEELICGLGEVAKYAFLISKTFQTYFVKYFNKLIELDKRVVEKIIYESVKFKGSVVSEDEFESGLRQILNFGHTFSHAIEIEQKHKIKHGEAVVIGIASALYLSEKMNILNQNKFSELLKIISPFTDLITVKKYNPENIYKVMFSDKKNRANKIKFVLIKNIGEIVLGIEADKKHVIDSINFGMNLFMH